MTTVLPVEDVMKTQQLMWAYQPSWTIEQIARGEFLIRHHGDYQGTEPTLQEAQDKIDRLTSHEE